jgi:SMODS and SLOG-associating 2TM effector domain family 4
MDIKNLSIIRQSFANTLFTHKVQEVASELQEKKANNIRVLNIIFTGIVLVLLVLQAAIPTALLLSYIAAGVTVGEIVFLVVQLTFNFEQKAVLHKNSALKFMGLRDSYRLLITDIMNENLDSSIIVARRDTLQHQYQVICDLAPQTSCKEYTEAQKRLNKKGAVSGEEFTWSDEEIDWFLPEGLRLPNSK